MPGVLTARITPGATTLNVKRNTLRHRGAGRGVSRRSVADLAVARVRRSASPRTAGSRDQLSATLAGLCGDEGIDELRSRLAQVAAGQPAEIDLPDIGAARAELDALEATRLAATAECRRPSSNATAAATRLTELSPAQRVSRTLWRLNAAAQRGHRPVGPERASAADDDLASSRHSACSGADR